MSDITIVANGKQHRTPPGGSVGDLLRAFGLAAPQVVVEHNGEPLPRDRFESTRLANGDRLEIAQVVGGG
ncbi:MAG TPA: sulfur carrier protein ThiS [Candidatus Eremiobacteraceae bacterium]|nr:sulfur carrier protein ThiS [Candidatus Eremiobacteraceae bacterium]